SLDLADVGTLAGNESTARIGHHKGLPRMWTAVALQGENRQSRNIEGRGTVGTGIGDADVQRRLDRMIAHIGRVVAGAAESRNNRPVERVIEAADARDVDLGGVEHLLTARHRQAVLRLVAARLGPPPTVLPIAKN